MTRDEFITHVESSQRDFRRFLTALCCGDVMLADDLAQESYMKAYISCDGFKDAHKFNAWIYRIGYNAFLNSRRSVHRTVEADDSLQLSASQGADDQFKYQALYAALESLSATERTSILLFYMEGYSAREIADILGCREVSVRQHLSRGRTHLRALLSGKIL